MIQRTLLSTLKERLFSGKAILLFGPRQVGKTTLLKQLIGTSEDALWLNGDELDVQQLFDTLSATRMKALIGPKKILILDEAQRIPQIGLRLKLLTDTLPELQVIATGSSSFELANQVNESLTGRKWEYQLFPISFAEMVQVHGLLEEKRLLPHRLVYGYYPEIVTQLGNEKNVLKQLSDSYLYKDILSLDKIHKPDKLIRLLQAIAYQLGSQVSYHELSQLCGLDSKTIEKYIQILEQAFVIYRLGSFSRNLRNELKNSKKIYFYDNGIRNAIIANFAPLESRSDVGALWENFILSERLKKNKYESRWVNQWFWRTKEQKEIDYLEEADGQLSSFEFKWNPKAKAKIPLAFLNAYPNSTTKIIDQSNFEDFIL